MLVSIAACITGGGGSGSGTPQPNMLRGDDATATFGAEAFHQQLTAMASQATPQAQRP